MLTKRIKTVLIIFSIFPIFSCDENLHDSQTFDSFEIQGEDLLSHKELKNIIGNIAEIQYEFENGRISADILEKEIKNSLDPLIKNGRNLHSKFLNNLARSGDLNKMSTHEIREIEDFSDQQLAELSFAINYSNYNFSIDPRIRSCLNTALGITGMYDLMRNTRALGSVQTTVKALRLVGRRALGWVGIGLMILDFTDCYYAL
ncbi:hypothetical protein [uncultured Cyclobacterium sp.]|uniref:hypothetical protein n=1 Tax=uncultured Cyclobacterium sp. TaxID=453820 RepID=UPI0030EDFEE5|tara:strand:- start:70678 stop:71286 length:609 start_codon:yes stop_codon:yes gene_type:complete